MTAGTSEPIVSNILLTIGLEPARAAMKHRVVFTPSGLSGEVADGTTVLAAARQLGVDLDSVCGGRGICGRCQVVPSIGAFAKWNITTTGDELDGWSALERDYRGGRPLGAGHRLGCAAAIHGDVVIDVPAASQVHRQVVRKELGALDLPAARRRPAVRPALRRGRSGGSSAPGCRRQTS